MKCLYCYWRGNDRSPNSLKVHLKRFHIDDGIYEKYLMEREAVSNFSFTHINPFIFTILWRKRPTFYYIIYQFIKLSIIIEIICVYILNKISKFKCNWKKKKWNFNKFTIKLMFYWIATKWKDFLIRIWYFDKDKKRFFSF